MAASPVAPDCCASDSCLARRGKTIVILGTAPSRIAARPGNPEKESEHSKESKLKTLRGLGHLLQSAITRRTAPRSPESMQCWHFPAHTPVTKKTRSCLAEQVRRTRPQDSVARTAVSDSARDSRSESAHSRPTRDRRTHLYRANRSNRASL